MPAMDAPLSGVHVVDLSWNLPGPYATFVLRSLGARVTKVEPPRGDPARHMPALFEMLNEGKDSVRLDLREPDQQERLLSLIDEADVLVEGFRPGVAARLGCGPEAALARNPRLVYCSISAYGQTGPRRDEPGHDLNAQALAGLCMLNRDASERPHGLSVPVADLSASMNAVSSIVAALYARERDGRGRVLDVAMVDGALSWATVWGEGVDLAAEARERTPPGLGPLARRLLLDRIDREGLHALPHYDVYRCRDGAWLALGVVDEKHFWRALCDVLELRRLARLPMPARTALGPVLKRLFARRLRRRNRADWVERLGAAGVPATPVLTSAEARRDPHLRARLVDERGRVRAPVSLAQATERG